MPIAESSMQNHVYSYVHGPGPVVEIMHGIGGCIHTLKHN